MYTQLIQRFKDAQTAAASAYSVVVGAEREAFKGSLRHLQEPRLPDNVWLGATVVSQTEADRDIPKLLATPARMKFLSMEPLLGAVDISDWLTPSYPHCSTGFHQGDAMPHDYCGTCAGHKSDAIHQASMHDFIDWVIVGGESGPGARPMHVDWVRSLRDQCANAGVPFLFKQWGEWFSTSIDKEHTARTAVMPDGKRATLNDQGREARLRWHEWTADTRHSSVQPAISIALGKKTAGRLLDGQLHDGFPLLDIA